jgi:hypothetical protein
LFQKQKPPRTLRPCCDCGEDTKFGVCTVCFLIFYLEVLSRKLLH